ncbi:polysaccharide deacetylase family protein [Galbibacter sp. EGI 63066]|uniref:polysaccharide deacetylase family protein n=1 Tax=Galbibacter sp. EGI 63066 TaxID=2993559 RepID=UPI0022494711|nr:polysaccharide deacetylase family protein [Galbibacter sp. EGI 63066]MCX2678744.1 polysaccharide deacetylase family protein [Galbibacter sp. EGI 63066]
MKPYLVKTPALIKWIFPKLCWDIKTNQKDIFLTFDDGPTPEVTPFVLKELEKYNAKATFFCIGKNVDQHPDIFNKIVVAGHAIGNHTHNHYNVKHHLLKDYLENIDWAEKTIENYHPKKMEKLFRPPYGRISRKATKAIRKKGYKIVMWDVLSADFDVDNSPEQCLKYVLNNIRPGSIVVFHDSVKAFEKLKVILPKVLKTLHEKEYNCKVLRN